jgi:hypothetical protein
LNSLPQTLSVLARGAAPAGVTAIKPKYAGENEGKLTGLADTMEYRRAGAASWTAVAGDSVTSLPPGVYEVRTRAVPAAGFHSAAVACTIEASRNYKVTATISLPSGERVADAGAPGKSDTKYLLVRFTHVYAANSAAPITGFDADVIENISGMTVGSVANDDVEPGAWRVNLFFPAPRDQDGTMMCPW